MRIFLLLLPLLIGSCGPAAGPSILTGAAVSELGFLPKNAEKWLNNWAANLDLTGVSWNDSRTATLISPSHVVMAAHYTRPANVAVMFHDKKGRPYERYITGVKVLNTGDIVVARLNLPLPAEVKWYQFANASDAKIGRPVIVSDQTKTLSVHRVDAVEGAVVRFGYIPTLNAIYQRNLIAGDSGNPSFILKGGLLYLLETHTTGGAGAGPFYGQPVVQASIRAAMEELGK
jgi:hypothetical protein